MKISTINTYNSFLQLKTPPAIEPKTTDTIKSKPGFLDNIYKVRPEIATLPDNVNSGYGVSIKPELKTLPELATLPEDINSGYGVKPEIATLPEDINNGYGVKPELATLPEDVNSGYGVRVKPELATLPEDINNGYGVKPELATLPEDVNSGYSARTKRSAWYDTWQKKENEVTDNTMQISTKRRADIVDNYLKTMSSSASTNKHIL